MPQSTITKFIDIETIQILVHCEYQYTTLHRILYNCFHNNTLYLLKGSPLMIEMHVFEFPWTRPINYKLFLIAVKDITLTYIVSPISQRQAKTLTKAWDTWNHNAIQPQTDVNDLQSVMAVKGLFTHGDFYCYFSWHQSNGWSNFLWANVKALTGGHIYGIYLVTRSGHWT